MLYNIDLELSLSKSWNGDLFFYCLDSFFIGAFYSDGVNGNIEVCHAPRIMYEGDYQMFVFKLLIWLLHD